MDNLLKPEGLDLGLDSESAAQKWNHWYHTFLNFLSATKANESDKLKLLLNFISPSMYEHISECGAFADAVNALKHLYVKPVNEVFAGHQLACRRHQSGENMDQFLQALKLLSKDCRCKAVTAEINRGDCIRDAFISGLSNLSIRQRLLENSTTGGSPMVSPNLRHATRERRTPSYLRDYVTS